MHGQKGTTPLSRRAFLSGGKLNAPTETVSAQKPYLPWSTPEGIVVACDQCNACLEACPEKIIVRGDGGFPTVRFDEGECTFCGDCRTICPQPVFTEYAPETADTKPVWNLKAKVLDTCFVYQKIQCQSCQDHCDPRAIRFQYQESAIPVPVISEEDCTGCGACVSVCPASSLIVTDLNPTR